MMAGGPILVDVVVDVQTTRWRRLRADATYVYRSVKLRLRELALRAAASRARSRR